MGEFAYHNGRRVKIGTCEDMLYLRWNQRALVTQSDTALFDPETLKVIRFRFPWPDEDGIEPGGFDNPFRGFRLDFEQPKDLEHGMVQFSAANGYLASLPCPESLAVVTMGSDHKPVTIHRNGYGGPASLVGQAWRSGRLVGIARCNGCQHQYRLEDGYEDAAAVAIRAEADRKVRDYERSVQLVAAGTWTETAEGDLDAARRINDIADRLLAGYRVGAAQ